MSKPLTYDINLLVKDPFLDSTFGQVLKWAVNIGRYIIIFTEVIVIISFGSRFYLDRKLASINKSINQKAAVIESHQELENNFRLVQAKINNYQQIEQQDNLVRIFPPLQQVVPRNVVLQSLRINQSEISAESIALSNDALNYFISNLQLSPHFQEISVNRIETRDQKRIGFKVRVSAEYSIPKE